MRKFFLSFLILFSFAVKGQDTCTNDARNYVNTNIIRNGVRLITAPMMNVALNKIINAIECVDGGVFVSTDSNTVVNYDVLNSQNTPPVSPSTGDVYLVGTVPTGAWVGHPKDVAEWNGSAWVFTDGVQGDFLYNATTALTYIFRSGNWVQTTGIPALNNGNTISSGLKIGTNNLKSLTFETNNKSVSRFDSIGRFYVYDTALRKSNKFLQIDSSTGRLIASAISANSGSSTLFPNGVKLVLSSRDFQADDKDYVLLCPVPGTIITMPTTNPFSEGDYIGVVMSSPDSYFETYNNGSGGTDKMYPYTANPTGTTLEQQSSSEVVILRALNQGTLWILPLCGAVKYSNDINGSNFKTLSRYNYDQSQNVTDSQSLSLAFSDSIRMSISRGNTISFAYAYDSISTNTAGDSMITFKAGVRRAYEIVSGSSGSTFNGLTGATGTNSINNADYSQEWKWNTLTSGGLNLTSTSSTLSANSSLFRVQLNTNQPTSGTYYYAGKFINRNVTGGANVALYLNTPFGAPARALEIDTGDVYFAKNNQLIWANGFSIIPSTSYAQISAPTSGYIAFRSNATNGFTFWNSSNQAFFTIYNAGSSQHGTIFGGDYTSGSFRSIGTSAVVIERNVGNLIFSANTGLTGSYASFTPNNIMTINGTNSNVGIGTTSPNASALLDLTSTTKTLKLMNMTATQASAISTPPKGSIIYVTDTNGTFTSAGLWMYGTSWKLILAE